MSAFSVGNNIQTVNATVKGARYFYGLRRTDDGDLYLIKADALKTTDGVQVNKPGDPTQNLPDFQRGIEFFSGRDEEHNKTYENLNYEQYRWHDRSLFYYVDDEGQLVVRVNEQYNYPDGVSP